MANYFSEEEEKKIFLDFQLNPKYARKIPESIQAWLDKLNKRYRFYGTEQIKDYYWFITDNFEIVGKAIENGAVAEIMSTELFPDGQSIMPKAKIVEDMYKIQQKELWPEKSK